MTKARRALAGAWACASALALAGASPAGPAAAEEATACIAGADRYETAAAISSSLPSGVAVAYVVTSGSSPTP